MNFAGNTDLQKLINDALTVANGPRAAILKLVAQKQHYCK